jgi:transposase-like protein
MTETRYSKKYPRKLTEEIVKQSLEDPRTILEQARELGVHKDTLGRARRIYEFEQFVNAQTDGDFIKIIKE